MTVLDRLTYAGNLANLQVVASHPRFTFIRGDICDAELVGAVARDHDIVINFAAETHVDRSIAGASDFVAANVAGADDVFVGVPDNLAGDMNGVSEGRRNDRYLCEAVPPAIENPGRNMDRSAHSGFLIAGTR